MKMTVTQTGYGLTATYLPIPPRHRAVMTADQARICLETKAGLRPQPKPGAHYVTAFEPAALLAEYQARMDVTR